MLIARLLITRAGAFPLALVCALALGAPVARAEPRRRAAIGAPTMRLGAQAKRPSPGRSRTAMIRAGRSK